MRTSLLLPLAPLALATGCTPRAVTPAARALPLDTPTTPDVGRGDVQVEVAAMGFSQGASTLDGGLRYRHRIAPRLTAEVDGGVMHLTNDGTGGARDGYTGRAGVVIQAADGHALRAVATAGAGGGHAPTAGSWAAIDLGAMVSGAHRLVRPYLGGDLSYADAIDRPTFTVGEGDGATRLQLPDTVHLRASGGLEVGSRDVAVLLGLAVDHTRALERDLPGSTGALFRDTAVGIGLGVRIATE